MSIVQPDAASAVSFAKWLMERQGYAVVPICPTGVKQREVVALASAEGLHCARMGTGSSRALVLSHKSIRLLFRDLSPTTRSYISRYAGIKLFPVPTDGPIEVDSYMTLPHVDCKAWLDIVSDLIADLGGEQRFIDLHRNTVASVGNLIMASRGFKAWKTRPEPKSTSLGDSLWKPRPVWDSDKTSATSNIYQEANDGRHFVSVDMVAANFQILKAAGLIKDSTWEQLVSRPDISCSTASTAYLARAKGLRMLALSNPALRPNLQRLLWSEVMLDAFKCLVERGAATPHDFAAFNSDEFIVHAESAEEALAKVNLFRQALNGAMPEWSHAFSYSAFRLSVMPASAGFERTCLVDGRVSFKCVKDRRSLLGKCVMTERPCPTLPFHATSPAFADEVVTIQADEPAFDDERKCCRETMLWLLASNGKPRNLDDIAARFVSAGVDIRRAVSLARYIVDHQGKGILTLSDHVVTRLSDLSTEAYVSEAWPSIDGSGAGQQCPLLPKEARLIVDLASCREATRAIGKCQTIGLDCEGIIQNQDTIPLSLIQIHAGGCSYLFDMLAPESKSFMGRGGLRKILSSRFIEKIIHDSRGDIQALASKHGCKLQNVFDTQIAHALSKGSNNGDDGRFVVSLNDMLLGCHLATNADKDNISKQTSRDILFWHHRPPTERAVKYAVADISNLTTAHGLLLRALSQDRRDKLAILCQERLDRAISMAMRQ
ncbi:DnaQ like exonuclease domain protein [Mollivirus kamchatka]|nr:DnaQ like exonuclease domain protein [Mollivirus kamchatka]